MRLLDFFTEDVSYNISVSTLYLSTPANHIISAYIDMSEHARDF